MHSGLVGVLETPTLRAAATTCTGPVVKVHPVQLYHLAEQRRAALLGQGHLSLVHKAVQVVVQLLCHPELNSSSALRQTSFFLSFTPSECHLS